MPITCPHCLREFQAEKLNARHLAKCAPGTSVPFEPCLCGHESTSLTQMKRHRRGCSVWTMRDKKSVCASRTRATNISRYGIEHANQTPEAQARKAATNKARYGAANVFSRESTRFEAIQRSLDGKRPILRGKANPFASEAVKQKIRATMEDRYGAKSPQQVPSIRARTKATCKERYGGELLGSPVIAARIRATNLIRYGDEFPQRMEAVKVKQQETNLERWGVSWTSMNPEIRQKQVSKMRSTYGSHFFASEEGRHRIREGMILKHGVDYFSKSTAYALLMPQIRERFQTTSLRNWGSTHPMKNREYARRHLEKMGVNTHGPNGLERKLHMLASDPSRLLFTGNGKFWLWLPKLRCHKNPDFVVPGPDLAHPKRGVVRVVEAFGDFWHSHRFTGSTPLVHEQELITAYADVGIECLVVWESEVNLLPKDVSLRLEAFISDG